MEMLGEKDSKGMRKIQGGHKSREEAVESKKNFFKMAIYATMMLSSQEKEDLKSEMFSHLEEEEEEEEQAEEEEEEQEEEQEEVDPPALPPVAVPKKLHVKVCGKCSNERLANIPSCVVCGSTFGVLKF